jgi:folate-binding protein YgfZ
MRFMLRVEPALVTDAWALLSLVGPRADAVLAAAGLPVPAEPDAVLALDGGGWVRRIPPLGDGAPVVDLLVPRAELAARADALLAAGAAPAGVDAYEALRVEARRPRLGVDTDHRTIPNETGWLTSAVHLAKGCYRGQETVARVHNLGRPPRRLVLLHLDGLAEQLPEAGTPVLAGTREVGPGRLRGPPPRARGSWPWPWSSSRRDGRRADRGRCPRGDRPRRRPACARRHGRCGAGTGPGRAVWQHPR